MAFQQGKDKFECQNCGAHHIAIWHRMIVRDQQLVACRSCGTVMFSGKSVKDYTEVRLAS